MYFCSVYDMAAVGKTTIIQTYSVEMEVFGVVGSSSTSTPQVMTYPRDALAYGQNSWGPVRLLCEED